MLKLDEKNIKLLDLLQINSRAQLKALSQEIGLSIDSTKKRMQKLEKLGIIGKFSIFIDPKKAGYDLIANIQIKLRNIEELELQKFIKHLCSHNNITTLITTLGDFDITCVMIAKNTDELELLSRQIRQKFKDLIADWKSVINLKIHKFEEYHF